MLNGSYQESAIPNKMEDIGRNIKYLKGFVDFYFEFVTNKKEIKEKIKGLKEVNDLVIIKVNTETTRTEINFKPRDKVRILGKEYIIDAVEHYLPPKWLMVVNANPILFNRYAEKVLILK